MGHIRKEKMMSRVPFVNGELIIPYNYHGTSRNRMLRTKEIERLRKKIERLKRKMEKLGAEVSPLPKLEEN